MERAKAPAMSKEAFQLSVIVHEDRQQSLQVDRRACQLWGRHEHETWLTWTLGDGLVQHPGLYLGDRFGTGELKLKLLLGEMGLAGLRCRFVENRFLNLRSPEKSPAESNIACIKC